MPKRYQHKREPLTQADSLRLQQECRTIQEKLVIWTLLDTGLRVDEFCKLDKTYIDWNNHSLTVWGKNTTGVGGRKRRSVPMTPRVKALLEPWIAQNDTIGFTKRTAENVVRRVAQRACVPNCSPHVLRHTFAVTSLDKGISLPALQKILGHNDLSTTAIYLNLSSGEAMREYQQKW